MRSPRREAKGRVRVLAVDPGSLAFGFAVSDRDDALEAYGSADLSKEKYAERFSALLTRLDDVWACFDIHEIAIEKPVRFRGNKIPALEVSYQAILNWARLRVKKDKIFSYHPATWRVGVTGKSNASKEYVSRIVYLHFPTLPAGVADHITDAVAILLYHFAMRRYDELVKGGR